MPNEKIIMVRSALLVPVLLVITAICMGCAISSWLFLAIPFVGIGWICAAPNLNCANGMLAYLAIIGGFILLGFHQPSGAAVVAGAMAGLYLSALEMRLTAKPYKPESFASTTNKDQTNKSCEATGDNVSS